MSETACFLTPGKTIASTLDRVALADKLGYEAVFSTNIAAHDGLMTLAAYASVTERIKLGTGVLPAFNRHPIALAQEAATLDEFSDGRLWLGIGTSHAATMQGWYGFPFDKPLTQLKEYLEILRALLRDGSVRHSGEYYTANFAFSGAGPRPEMPIMISGLSPKTLAYAGATCDGVILWCCLPSYIEQTVAPIVRQAERDAGRPEGSCKIIAAIPSAVGDEEVIRSSLRRDLLVYWSLPFYRAVIGEAGFADDIARFDEKLAGGDTKAAVGQIPDAFLDQLAGIGTADAVKSRVETYRAAGCDLPAVGMISTPREASTPEAALEAAAPTA
jgi:alkanesulfonate monooxygenase SsuD/methylene tetrahydromethanopterin reductase-like flavin-dependent oxidoreductase (luciferase family)